MTEPTLNPARLPGPAADRHAAEGGPRAWGSSASSAWPSALPATTPSSTSRTCWRTCSCSGSRSAASTLLMIHHLSGGRWSLVLRRTFEASARTIPLMAVLFLPVILGIHDLYEWSHADVVASDPILLHKAPYLNQTGFILRAVGYFVHLVVPGADAVAAGRRSRTRQDFPLDRFNKISGPGVLILSLTVTFASVDWVMSLDPHWFSTIFGLWFLDGHGADGARVLDRRRVVAAQQRPRREGAVDGPLPRLRHAALRLHHAVGVPRVLAVPDRLVGEPARGDSLLPAPLRRRLAGRDAGRSSRATSCCPGCCCCSAPPSASRVAWSRWRA